MSKPEFKSVDNSPKLDTYTFWSSAVWVTAFVLSLTTSASDAAPVVVVGGIFVFVVPWKGGNDGDGTKGGGGVNVGWYWCVVEVGVRSGATLFPGCVSVGKGKSFSIFNPGTVGKRRGCPVVGLGGSTTVEGYVAGRSAGVEGGRVGVKLCGTTSNGLVRVVGSPPEESAVVVVTGWLVVIRLAMNG